MSEMPHPRPDWVIPVGRLIELIRNVEGAYPVASPHEILSRIRSLYYGDFAFRRLIPGTDYGGRTAIERADAGTQWRLLLKANENGIGDNPSPYYRLENGEQLDLGHVVLGIEALLSTDTSDPFNTYGIPRIDPSSWVADVALAVAWADDASSRPAEIRPKETALIAAGEPDPYWLCSAPLEDLLGDVDFFGLHTDWDGTRKLSEIFSSYYGGIGVRTRWARFRAHPGNAWAFGSRSDVEARVNRMAQLAADGGAWAAANTALSWVDFFVDPIPSAGRISPSRRTYASTSKYVRRFFTWVAKENGLAPV